MYTIVGARGINMYEFGTFRSGEDAKKQLYDAMFNISEYNRTGDSIYLSVANNILGASDLNKEPCVSYKIVKND